MRYLKPILLAILVFVVGLWFLSPWERLGACMLSEIKLAAAKNGVYITISDMESSGKLTPKYLFRDFEVEAPVVMLKLSDLTVKLLPLSSLTSFSGVCVVSFGEGEITLFPKSKLKIQSGMLRLAANGSGFKITDVEIDGDLKMSGQLAYDKNTKSITDNALTFKVPDSIASMFANPLLERYIESVSPGEWRIRQDASSKP